MKVKVSLLGGDIRGDRAEVCLEFSGEEVPLSEVLEESKAVFQSRGMEIDIKSMLVYLDQQLVLPQSITRTTVRDDQRCRLIPPVSGGLEDASQSRIC